MTTNSTQDQALNWFVRLSDQAASEADWIEFQDWIEADPAHGKAYDLIEQVWVALEDADPSVETAVETTVVAPARRRSTFLSQRWLAPAMGLAATAVMVVGLWPEISGVGRFQTFSTEEASRDVVLSDGSRLAMNRHSDLRARIGSRGREVVLSEGEVAFDVSHDAARPFVVAAGEHEVRVLGTAFNVLSHDGRFAVGVQRGLVAVSGAAMTDAVRLGVGERIDQSRLGEAVVSRIDPEQASAWRQGVLVYRGADLGAVGEDLSRYLDKPVNVVGSARALRFTGALRIGDEATMLRQLQDFVPIGVTQENDGIRLTARAAG